MQAFYKSASLLGTIYRDLCQRSFTKTTLLLLACLLLLYLAVSSYYTQSIEKTGIYAHDSHRHSYATATATQQGSVYTSRNGSKYYFGWCNSRVKESNKIFFNDAASAERYGYQRAKNC